LTISNLADGARGRAIGSQAEATLLGSNASREGNGVKGLHGGWEMVDERVAQWKCELTGEWRESDLKSPFSDYIVVKLFKAWGSLAIWSTGPQDNVEGSETAHRRYSRRSKEG